MPMDAAARSAAAYKAAATKRARKLAGYANPNPRPQPSPTQPPPPRPTPPPYTPPAAAAAPRTQAQATVLSWRTAVSPAQQARDAKLEVLVKLEVAVALLFAANPITAEADAAWTKYQSVKARVLTANPNADPQTRNEDANALRVALIALVKLVF